MSFSDISLSLETPPVGLRLHFDLRGLSVTGDFGRPQVAPVWPRATIQPNGVGGNLETSSSVMLLAN